MKTIESYIEGKKQDQSLCEDGLYVGETIVAVIDGVTAQSETLFDGKLGGCFAKDILLDYISTNESSLSKMKAVDMYEHLNAVLTNAVKATVGYDLQVEEYPRAGILIYNEYLHEVSSYGDCQLIINEKYYDFSKEIDRINSEFRSLVLESAVINGTSYEELLINDIGREAIKPGLVGRFAFENVDGAYGYPVLNGYSFNKNMVFFVSVHRDDELILATDGYPILKSTLKESEDALIDVLKEDRLCFRKYKSTKGVSTDANSFDDRTFWKGIVD